MPLTTEERKELVRTWGDRSGKGLVRDLCPNLYFPSHINFHVAVCMKTMLIL